MPERKPVEAGQAIIKGGYRNANYATRAKPHITYEEIETRTVKHGPFDYVTVEGTGRFKKNRFRVWGDGVFHSIDATAAALKGVIRLVREREAEEIAAIDAEIAAIQAAHVEAVARRKAAMARAFQNGHVLTLAEAKAVADEKLAAHEDRAAAKA